MKHAGLIIFVVGMVMVFFVSCEKDEDFAYDIDDLADVQWGMPEVEQGSVSHMEPAPVIFETNGRVTFGNTASYFWEVQSSRALYISEREQIWEIMDLSEERLYVEILRYPGGEFLARGVYYPED
ncbi:MAG: hypothetical protein ACLFT6_06855 [Bacteroidales bacterium]